MSQMSGGHHEFKGDDGAQSYMPAGSIHILRNPFVLIGVVRRGESGGYHT